MKTEYLVVVNYNAGGRQGERDWPLIETLLRDAGVEFKAVFTKYRHHAIKLIREKTEEGYRKIIVVGGRPLAGNKFFTMNIGIGKFSGGGMQQVPDAIIDDGLFDVMLVNKIRKSKIVYKIKKLYDGNIGDLKEVNLFKSRYLKIDSADKVMLEVDGESLGHTPFKFEVIDEKLKVIVK